MRTIKIQSLKLTPQQIIDKYPELSTQFHWKVQDIGVLLRCKLLHGHYDSQRRQSMIDESSLKRLINFMNDNLDYGKVNINGH